MRINKWLIAALFLISPSLYAHTGGHIEHSLLSGLLHPLTGIDHLLVLLAVGLIAAKQGGIAFPAAFFGLMASGALLNAAGVQIPFVESLIALSVVAFGLLVNIRQKQRSNLIFLGASSFAVFHGYAHAAEIPADVGAVQYFSALIAMSLAVSAIGGVIGLTTGKRIGYLFSLLCLSSGLYFLAAG
jgi:urease accessory protein